MIEPMGNILGIHTELELGLNDHENLQRNLLIICPKYNRFIYQRLNFVKGYPHKKKKRPLKA
jgi:hypothetical protein